MCSGWLVGAILRHPSGAWPCRLWMERLLDWAKDWSHGKDSRGTDSLRRYRANTLPSHNGLENSLLHHEVQTCEICSHKICYSITDWYCCTHLEIVRSFQRKKEILWHMYCISFFWNSKVVQESAWAVTATRIKKWALHSEIYLKAADNVWLICNLWENTTALTTERQKQTKAEKQKFWWLSI